MPLIGRGHTGIASEAYCNQLPWIGLKNRVASECYGLSGSMSAWQTRT